MSRGLPGMLLAVVLLAPVLPPPSVRIFDAQSSFAFANPAAVAGPGAHVVGPAPSLTVLPRLAAVIGAEGAIGGFTVLAEWRAPELASPKDHDFALLLGPVVDTEVHDDFDWEAARALAELNTRLRPGDLLAAPPLTLQENVPSGLLELTIPGVGVLAANVP